MYVLLRDQKNVAICLNHSFQTVRSVCPGGLGELQGRPVEQKTLQRKKEQMHEDVDVSFCILPVVFFPLTNTTNSWSCSSGCDTQLTEAIKVLQNISTRYTQLAVKCLSDLNTQKRYTHSSLSVNTLQIYVICPLE